MIVMDNNDKRRRKFSDSKLAVFVYFTFKVIFAQFIPILWGR